MQERVVLKDFNIAKEAGGPGKPIVKSFNVSVTSHTLKIHLYWPGKGTTGIPVRGVYGPLISAISVDPSTLQFRSNANEWIFKDEDFLVHMSYNRTNLF